MILRKRSLFTRSRIFGQFVQGTLGLRVDDFINQVTILEALSLSIDNAIDLVARSVVSNQYIYSCSTNMVKAPTLDEYPKTRIKYSAPTTVDQVTTL